MRFLLIFTLLTGFSAHGQYFRVDPEFYNPAEPTGFSFRVTGLAQFNDSMQVSIVLTTPDSLGTVLFSGIWDFVNPAASSLPGFVYNPTTESFSVPLGTFPSTQMYLWIRSSVAGVIREEILVTQFDSPNHAE